VQYSEGPEAASRLVVLEDTQAKREFEELRFVGLRRNFVAKEGWGTFVLAKSHKDPTRHDAQSLARIKVHAPLQAIGDQMRSFAKKSVIQNDECSAAGAIDCGGPPAMLDSVKHSQKQLSNYGKSQSTPVTLHMYGDQRAHNAYEGVVICNLCQRFVRWRQTADRKFSRLNGEPRSKALSLWT